MKKDQVDLILNQWLRERPDIDCSPMAIIGRISRTSHYLSQKLQENLLKAGLQSIDFDVLATLRRSGEPYTMTPTALYRFMMLTSGAMTNRLDRLEKAGYIERRPHPTDRRGTLITLTKQGLEAINSALISHVSKEEELLSVLSSEERDRFASTLRKLLLSLGDEASEE
jgi:DNA-binding MarR family transcriptional regulator